MPLVSSINFDAKCADIAEQAIYKVLSVAVDILWNDFGGLQKRNERLKFFSDAFRYKLAHRRRSYSGAGGSYEGLRGPDQL